MAKSMKKTVEKSKGSENKKGIIGGKCGCSGKRIL
jgi:hypothetical protein